LIGRFSAEFFSGDADGYAHESAIFAPGRGKTMSIGAISAGSLSQYVSASSNLTKSQQAWQTLQQSLAAGNLSAAQTAFNSYQQLNQNLTNISGSSSSTTQLSTDMTALGSALSSGNLSAAQSAFATVQADMKNSPSQAMTNANAAMAQVQQWVNDLLDVSNAISSSSTSSDPTAALLQNALSLNSASTSTDPATEALQSAYGAATSASSTGTSMGSNGVNVYG
jgi:hypothetical protein